MKEILRSAFLGFMYGMLYISGVPIELLLIFGAIMLVFIVFKKKIKGPIDNLFNNYEFLAKIPIKLRPALTFIVILLIFMIVKQIIYFCLNYFFGIDLNLEQYINTTAAELK
jgi:type IV secretory pathway VirB3-like protein